MISDLEDFRGLLNRVKEGDDSAAWELVERYGEDIRNAVRRSLNQRLRPKFDSLDFVQLVWSSFFRKDTHAERFGCPEELVAYLVAMARNKVGMETRRRLSIKKIQRESRVIVGRRIARLPRRDSFPIADTHGIRHCQGTLGSPVVEQSKPLQTDNPISIAGTHLPGYRRYLAYRRKHRPSIS